MNNEIILLTESGAIRLPESRRCGTGSYSLLRRFRKYLTCLCCMGFVVLSGCGDITLVTRTMTDPIPVVTIPGAPLPVELSLEFDLAIDGQLFGIEADSRFITFARLLELKLVILDSSDTDPLEDGAVDSFDFLQGLEVSIRASFGGEVVEQPIAFLPEGDPQIGAAARTLLLESSRGDVLDFLQASGGYELIFNLQGIVPPDNIIISGLARYSVGVGI